MGRAPEPGLDDENRRPGPRRHILAKGYRLVSRIGDPHEGVRPVVPPVAYGPSPGQGSRMALGRNGKKQVGTNRQHPGSDPGLVDLLKEILSRVCRALCYTEGR